MADQQQPAPSGTLSLTDRKLLCEIAKLEADAAEIRKRIELQDTAGERFKRVLGPWLPLITVVSGGIAILVSLMTFANGLAAQQARQLRFNVSQQFVELTTRLQNSELDESERTNATLLLANYEEFAVPVLIRSITMPDVVIKDVGEALRLIVDRDDLPSASPSWLGRVFGWLLLSKPPDLEQYVLTVLDNKLAQSVDGLTGQGSDDFERFDTAQRYVEVLVIVDEGRCSERVKSRFGEIHEQFDDNHDPGAIALDKAVESALMRFQLNCQSASEPGA